MLKRASGTNNVMVAKAVEYRFLFLPAGGEMALEQPGAVLVLPRQQVVMNASACSPPVVRCLGNRRVRWPYVRRS